MYSQLTRDELSRLCRDPATYFTTLPERENREFICNMALYVRDELNGKVFTGFRVNMPTGHIHTASLRNDDTQHEFIVSSEIMLNAARCYYWYISPQPGDFKHVSEGIVTFGNGNVVHTGRNIFLGDHPSGTQIAAFLTSAK